MLELCGMQNTPSLPSLPDPLWPEVVAPDNGPFYGLNRSKRWLEFTGVFFFWHLNWVIMLNWIARNRTLLASKRCTYATVNYLKLKCFDNKSEYCPVGWGCRIRRLHLCRGVRPPNERPGYNTKPSDIEVSVMLELWGMRSTPSLPLPPGPLWLGMVATDRALSMGWIELAAYLC